MSVRVSLIKIYNPQDSGVFRAFTCFTSIRIYELYLIYLNIITVEKLKCTNVLSSI